MFLITSLTPQITAHDLQYLEILGHGSGGTVYRYARGGGGGGGGGGGCICTHTITFCAIPTNQARNKLLWQIFAGAKFRDQQYIGDSLAQDRMSTHFYAKET